MRSLFHPSQGIFCAARKGRWRNSSGMPTRKKELRAIGSISSKGPGKSFPSHRSRCAKPDLRTKRDGTPRAIGLWRWTRLGRKASLHRRHGVIKVTVAFTKENGTNENAAREESRVEMLCLAGVHSYRLCA